MIVSNNLSKSTLRWLQTCILLGALMVLPLGLTKAQNSGDVNQDSAESTISEVHETHPQAITSELEKHQRFPLVFDEIRQFVEIDDIWVISVDWSENPLTIKGTARSNVVVADFMRNMESSSLFQNVELRNIRVRQSGTQEVSDFHITAMLNSYSEAPVEFLSQELLQKFLPLKRDIPLLLHQITSSLSDAGLDVRVFEPGAVIPKDGYSETPIQIEVTGKYKNIMTTIGAIKTIERFVTFRDIEFNSDEKDAVARMSMTIVAYHRNTPPGFQ